MNHPVTLIGQFIVDVSLPSANSEIKLRAGGIMHAARALWAIDEPYSLCYCAPQYLEQHVIENGKRYNARQVDCVGRVTGAPNVMLIREPKELADQGYELLLRDSHQCDIEENLIADHIKAISSSDVLLFPGQFPLPKVLHQLINSNVRLHVDANHDSGDVSQYSILNRPIETLIYSTSSSAFHGIFNEDFTTIHNQILCGLANGLLLKENRGGSRFAKNDEIIRIPAQTREIMHSIGVGDCFNAVFVALRRKFSDHASLCYASCIAAEYASTTYPECFKDAALAWLSIDPHEITELHGVSLPWEKRNQIDIYIAAPDFEHVDRTYLEKLISSLSYHNFKPRLPVREGGMMGLNATASRRQSLCDSDMKVLEECCLLIAVLLYDDPGTLIEIGIAVERGLPVIVYDPYGRADNLMLTQLPNCVSQDLDSVLSAVFRLVAKVAL